MIGFEAPPSGEPEVLKACCGMCWETVPVAEFVTLSDRLDVYRAISDDGMPQTTVALDGARFNDDEFPPLGLRVVTSEGCSRMVSGGACRSGEHGWFDEHGARWLTTAIAGLTPGDRDQPGEITARFKDRS